MRYCARWSCRKNQTERHLRRRIPLQHWFEIEFDCFLRRGWKFNIKIIKQRTVILLLSNLNINTLMFCLKPTQHSSLTIFEWFGSFQGEAKTSNYFICENIVLDSSRIAIKNKYCRKIHEIWHFFWRKRNLRQSGKDVGKKIESQRDAFFIRSSNGYTEWKHMDILIDILHCLCVW